MTVLNQCLGAKYIQIKYKIVLTTAVSLHTAVTAVADLQVLRITALMIKQKQYKTNFYFYFYFLNKTFLLRSFNIVLYKVGLILIKGSFESIF